MKKILFIGATGMLGKPVALELIRAGFDLTLLGRNTERLQQLFPNISVVKGDVFDPASLTSAMTSHDIVYMNLNIKQTDNKTQPLTEREGLQNIISTAAANGVQRLGFLSSLVMNYQGMNGFNWWAFDIRHRAADMIKKSGMRYSIFYPSTFMETLDKQMLKGSRLMLAGKSEAPMWFIAAKDFGIQVAWAFKKTEDANQEYTIQGPEPYTFDEAARIFIENYRKSKLNTMKAPVAPLKILGIFNQRLNYAANILEALNKYPEKFVSDKTWNDLGKPSTTLAQYASSL